MYQNLIVKKSFSLLFLSADCTVKKFNEFCFLSLKTVNSTVLVQKIENSSFLVRYTSRSYNKKLPNDRNGTILVFQNKRKTLLFLIRFIRPFYKKQKYWSDFFSLLRYGHGLNFWSHPVFAKKNIFARDGDRTHAHIRELDLKSNALTTRPPWLILNLKMVLNRIFFRFLICNIFYPLIYLLIKTIYFVYWKMKELGKCTI